MTILSMFNNNKLIRFPNHRKSMTRKWHWLGRGFSWDGQTIRVCQNRKLQWFAQVPGVVGVVGFHPRKRTTVCSCKRLKANVWGNTCLVIKSRYRLSGRKIPPFLRVPVDRSGCRPAHLRQTIFHRQPQLPEYT